MDKKRLRIVIVGGGFAGLKFLNTIDKKRYEVILVDRNNYHSFPPLFYQIASSGLEPGSICFPFRRELSKSRGEGASFHLGDVHTINFENKSVVTQYETISYDYLIIAAGTTNNFFNNRSLRRTVFTIKSTEEAMRCRNEILFRLEQASICPDAAIRRRLLSFMVIGGGPAGVEMAGALGEMKRYIIPREYKTISPDDVSITLLESSPALLGAMGRKAQDEAYAYLRNLLVNVELNHRMENYENNIVTLDSGSQIYSEMVIWTAGVIAEEFNFNGAELTKCTGNRILVDEYNRVIGVPDVFAIGDIAGMESDTYPKCHPQLAQVAIQQGRLLAKNLNRGQFTKRFKYNDMGIMATVGKNLAVADLSHLHLSGRTAWFIWMFVHLISILGMRNKIAVLIDWIWSYFNYGSSLRLLLRPSRHPNADHSN